MNLDWEFVETVVKDMLSRGVFDERIRKVAGGGAPPPPSPAYNTGAYDSGSYG